METGERNVVCHVIRLNEITFEFQSALNPGNKDFGTFLERHGDAVKDIAFNCTDVDALILKVGVFSKILRTVYFQNECRRKNAAYGI